MIGPYPKDPFIDNRNRPQRSWAVWLNNLRNKVDFGTPPSPETEISAASGIELSSSHMRIKGAGGSPITITANPQITKGFDGQSILVEGLDNVAPVTMNNGNGVELKTASIVFDKNTIYEFIYNEMQNLWIRKL